MAPQLRRNWILVDEFHSLWGAGGSSQFKNPSTLRHILGYISGRYRHITPGYISEGSVTSQSSQFTKDPYCLKFLSTHASLGRAREELWKKFSRFFEVQARLGCEELSYNSEMPSLLPETAIGTKQNEHTNPVLVRTVRNLGCYGGFHHEGTSLWDEVERGWQRRAGVATSMDVSEPPIDGVGDIESTTIGKR
jgi:hypothetical protein